ncbi:helix-turn-helix domain-containing protein [Methylobacterium sp. WL103]|nr:helix-turn-helix domain-containing protein [Methylobacterium sp. WL103]
MDQLAAFDVPTFCDRYGVSRATAYKELSSGRLLGTKVGRKTLIRSTDAEGWLASLPNFQGGSRTSRHER